MQPTEEMTYREGINRRFDSIDAGIARLDEKVSYTNGKVRKHEKIIWLASGVIITMMLTGNEAALHFILSIL